MQRSEGSGALPALLYFLALGCSDRPPEPAPSAIPTARVVLSPGALPEGTLDAFGLALPARSSLKRRSPTSVTADVPSSFEETLAYLRERVIVGEERRAKKRLFLEDVRLRASPEGQRLRIALRALTSTTEVVVSVEASRAEEVTEEDPGLDPPSVPASSEAP